MGGVTSCTGDCQAQRKESRRGRQIEREREEDRQRRREIKERESDREERGERERIEGVERYEK